MKIRLIFCFCFALILSSCTTKENLPVVRNKAFIPFKPLMTHDQAFAKAGTIVQDMTVDQRIEMIGGHNRFFIQGVPEANLPQLYLSDATQGVHIRTDLDQQLKKSTAMPCPIMLTATWDRNLAHDYAKSVGEECRAGGIAVLLGPGLNMYRISQDGRSFEFFGEDPYLTARMVENYVAGVESTGTMATLKHFIANNTEHRRRTSNSVVSSRALHEIYMPGFKAGVDAGAMAVMTSYNQVNGEWSGQSKYVITDLLRGDLGFKWLVMTDWWSIWQPAKAIKSGLDLDMPGDGGEPWVSGIYGNPFLRRNAKQLLKEGKVEETDIDRMAGNIIATELAMGLDKRPVKDTSYLKDYPQHLAVALKAAEEGIVLLKNKNNILPITDANLKILATGKMMEERVSGGGSADVQGYDWLNMFDALRSRLGDRISYVENPTDDQIQAADIVLCATGTFDSEGHDTPFELPDEENARIKNIAAHNKNVVVIVNSGGGIGMTDWNDDIAGLVYSWYPGQIGNKALAEVLAGDVCPSGKLPITIEKKFEDSPGYPYVPEGEKTEQNWGNTEIKQPVYDIKYNEGVFVGYRWYEHKNIEPLYHFGFGLSYTSFKYDGLELSAPSMQKGDTIKVRFTLENTGKTEGTETAQMYISDVKSSVERPVKELKDFIRVDLKPGEKKMVELEINQADLSFFDEASNSWVAEPGEFKVLVGSASNDIRLEDTFNLTE